MEKINVYSIKYILIFIFFSIYIFPVQAKLECSITDTCMYSKIFRISDLTNAHAELANDTNYGYVVCCRETDGNPLSGSCAESYAPTIVKLSESENAHGEFFNESNYNIGVCLESYNNLYTFDVKISTTDCSAYDTCIVALSDSANAHFSNCTEYANLLCATAHLRSSTSGGQHDTGGVTPAQPSTPPVQIAQVCGDNICSSQENYTSCPKDCSKNYLVYPQSLSVKVINGQLSDLYITVRNLRNNSLYMNVTFTNLSTSAFVNSSVNLSQLQSRHISFFYGFSNYQNLNFMINNLSNYTFTTRFNFLDKEAVGIYFIGVQLNDDVDKTIVPLIVEVVDSSIPEIILSPINKLSEITAYALFGQMYVSNIFKMPIPNVFAFILILVMLSYFSTKRIKNIYKKTAAVGLIFFVLLVVFYLLSQRA